MKVSELEGADLDYWVARAEGVPEEQLLFPLARSGERVCSVLPPTNGFPMGPGVYIRPKNGQSVGLSLSSMFMKLLHVATQSMTGARSQKH